MVRKLLKQKTLQRKPLAVAPKRPEAAPKRPEKDLKAKAPAVKSAKTDKNVKADKDSKTDKDAKSAKAKSAKEVKGDAKKGDLKSKDGKKPRPPKDPNAPPKKKRSKSGVVRLKAFWGVFNQMMKRVALFEYAERRQADKKASELSGTSKAPHFVQLVKEVIRDAE